MNIKNCRLCNKLFQYPGFGETICLNCRKQEDEEISKIKNFLYDNPNANVHILSEELEIPTKRLFYYIETGTIQIRNNDKVNYCKRCSNLISFGDEYCQKCKKELINGFKGTAVFNEYNKDEKQKDERMRFIRKERE